MVARPKQPNHPKLAAKPAKHSSQGRGKKYKEQKFKTIKKVEIA